MSNLGFSEINWDDTMVFREKETINTKPCPWCEHTVAIVGDNYESSALVTSRTICPKCDAIRCDLDK